MSRYNDVQFDNTQLPPIYGYWSQPLVPLEQALQSIRPPIDQLPRYIQVAKKHCRYPSEHRLSRDESAAVYLYTMEWGDESLYRVLNKALRSEKRRELTQWFPYLKLFDTALKKLPTVRECLWRGIDGGLTKKLQKDQDLIWWAVSSCSSSVDVIKDFVGKDATLFMVQAMNGKDISGYTNFPGENEVLLGPGTRLRVAAGTFDHAGGLRVVHLKEVSEEGDDGLASGMAAVQVSPVSSSGCATGTIHADLSKTGEKQ